MATGMHAMWLLSCVYMAYMVMALWYFVGGILNEGGQCSALRQRLTCRLMHACIYQEA